MHAASSSAPPREPRRAHAVQVARQPEDDAAQPRIGRERQQQRDERAPPRRDHDAREQQPRRRIARLAAPQLAARESEHERDRHERAGERRHIDEPPCAAGDHRDEREAGRAAGHAEHVRIGERVAQQHLQQRAGQREQRTAREARERARQAQRADDVGKQRVAAMRHERRERLPRRHRHAADRQRRDEQQRDRRGQCGPDRGGARGAHAALRATDDTARIGALPLRAGRDIGAVQRVAGIPKLVVLAVRWSTRATTFRQSPGSRTSSRWQKSAPPTIGVSIEDQSREALRAPLPRRPRVTKPVQAPRLGRYPGWRRSGSPSRAKTRSGPRPHAKRACGTRPSRPASCNAAAYRCGGSAGWRLPGGARALLPV